MIGTRPEPPYTELCGSTPAHGPVKPVRYSPPCLPPGAGLKEPAAGEAAALPPPGAGCHPKVRARRSWPWLRPSCCCWSCRRRLQRRAPRCSAPLRASPPAGLPAAAERQAVRHLPSPRLPRPRGCRRRTADSRSEVDSTGRALAGILPSCGAMSRSGGMPMWPGTKHLAGRAARSRRQRSAPGRAVTAGATLRRGELGDLLPFDLSDTSDHELRDAVVMLHAVRRPPANGIHRHEDLAAVIWVAGAEHGKHTLRRETGAWPALHVPTERRLECDARRYTHRIPAHIDEAATWQTGVHVIARGARGRALRRPCPVPQANEADGNLLAHLR